MYVLLVQLITDDALIDHLAEVVLVRCLCNKVTVLCPLSSLSSLEESHDVQSVLQEWGAMLHFLQVGVSA